ncbi:MAG: OmpA family protein [Rhodothermia bacterium]|nr:OmpA family protein [Rhodothermia bacterium]
MPSLRTFGRITFLLLLSILIVGSTTAEAQLWKKVKKAAKRTVENEAERKTERAVRNALNLAEDVVVCMVGDTQCAQEAERNGQEYVVADDDGNVVSDHRHHAVEEKPDETSTEPDEPTRLKPGEGVWANYDFVPGDKVLFYDDYAKDRVGDFPRRLEFVEGNMEIVEFDGNRAVRFTNASAFSVKLPEELPERFTVEFPVHWTHGNQTLIVLTNLPDNVRHRPTVSSAYKGSYIIVDERGTGVEDRGNVGGKSTAGARKEIREGFIPVRIMADGSYVKVFLDERRVANVPNAVLGRSNTVHFGLRWADQDNPAYIGPIRVAAGGRDLYDRLQSDGRVATQGILFDTGSDRIQPESTPTLDEIGRMLADHPDLRLAIEGHTDNVGDDAYNLELSKKRASAVVQYLVNEFGVSPDRLESEGFGETKPADANDTPEGRQNNRRVELVNLAA